MSEIWPIKELWLRLGRSTLDISVLRSNDDELSLLDSINGTG
jgi:hypothetical protein